MDNQMREQINRLATLIDEQHKELLEESDAHAVALKQLGEALAEIDRLKAAIRAAEGE